MSFILRIARTAALTAVDNSIRVKSKAMPFDIVFLMESLILAQDERLRRA